MAAALRQEKHKLRRANDPARNLPGSVHVRQLEWVDSGNRHAGRPIQRAGIEAGVTTPANRSRLRDIPHWRRFRGNKRRSQHSDGGRKEHRPRKSNEKTEGQVR